MNSKNQFPLLRKLFVLLTVMLASQSAWALGGTGESTNPYTIATAQDMKAFANKDNAGEPNAWGKLTADIVLTGTWTPMGSSTSPYTGTFDGQGHKITVLSINATADDAGFFGYVNGATIKNFTLAGSVTSSNHNTHDTLPMAAEDEKLFTSSALPKGASDIFPDVEPGCSEDAANR